jgi:hypothetical protein
MGKFVNPDNSAFQKALNSKIYVDKTELLEYTNGVLDTLQGYICNSRPRRFGKSITADMLVAYYSKGCNSEKMFSDLKIGQSADFKKHLNQYDVIHLDIQWCIEPAGGPELLVSYISQEVISELRVYYPDVLDETITSLPEALFQINTAKGNRFVVIIDEWDVLIRDEASDLKIQEQYINFLRGMFKGAAPTKYIQLAYLTGILPIKKIRTQSALNNFEEFSMIDAGELASYIGFTEKEVMSLCKTYEVDFDKVKCWYDGYILGDNQIYNPKAVVSVLTKRKFKSYWSETGSYRAIIPLINMDFNGLKTAIIEMLSGAEVRIDVTSFQNDTTNFANRDDVLTYLIHLGYLGYNEDTETAFVPNEEVRQELVKATRQTKWNQLLELQQESDQLLDATLRLDGDAVAKQLGKIHDGYASVIQYNNENSLSSVLAIAYLSAIKYYFRPVRELPTGRGLADFVFIPKPEYKNEYPALVVELKWNKSVQTALQQIKDKEYPKSLEEYTGDILLVAINYDKKKNHQCLIEQYEK